MKKLLIFNCHQPRACGTEKAGRITQETPRTSVAIGGIDADNLPSLLNAGISNFCVVRAVNKATDPSAAIARLQKI